MLRPTPVHFRVPVGSGVKIADADDPLLLQFPLVIEGSIGMSAGAIYQKFLDYRLWHSLNEAHESGLMPGVAGLPVADLIQSVYSQICDSSEDEGEIAFAGLIYPKKAAPDVISQLAKLFPVLPSVVDDRGFDRSSRLWGHTGRAVHVEGPSGTRSLHILSQPLDIEVPDSSIFTFLINPSDPPWHVTVSKDGPAVYAYAVERPRFLTETEASERAAWNNVKEWLRSSGHLVDQEQLYPEGSNKYPDFRASVDGQEYDIEMTSTPDMKKWTIRSRFRDLERVISEAAKQPSESREEVVDKLHEVLAVKASRVSEALSKGIIRRSVVVVTNWSTYPLSDSGLWPKEKIDIFDAVFLLDINEVLCIKAPISRGGQWHSPM